MRSIVYKYPVVSGVLINIFTMLLSIFMLKYDILYLMVYMPLIGILNRKIIDNGVNMNNKKKLVLITSFIIMLVVFLFYNKYIHKISVNKILNR